MGSLQHRIHENTRFVQNRSNRVSAEYERATSPASTRKNTMRSLEDVEGLAETLEYDLSGQGVGALVVVEAKSMARAEVEPKAMVHVEVEAMGQANVATKHLRNHDEGWRRQVRHEKLMSSRANPKSIAKAYHGLDPNTLPRPTPYDTLFSISEKKKKEKGKKIVEGNPKRHAKGISHASPSVSQRRN
ncbi:hypothetical protein Fmac_007672 [Flemingia macrophylla]|uniref:Uncharacterized protein n=1 Tax=Flemingia macrophylla TaxID=520843 RepID=A0ABD1MV85_9FABA